MAIKYKDLARLRFRQLTRGKSKGILAAYIVMTAYLWLAEILIAVVVKSDGQEIPALAAAIVMSCFLPMDFIIKLIFVQDCTVMDAFLKTRPLSQEMWDRFLTLSQLWKASNLVMPLGLAPACFIFMPFFPGLLFLLFVYLASAFGGFLVMLIKHRGPYQSEKMMSSVKASKVKSAKGNYVSRLTLRGFKRSKRLRNSLILVFALFYLQCVSKSLTINDMGSFMSFVLVFMSSCVFTMNGFAVEANFFEGIWSRPIRILSLFENKYYIGFVSGLVGVLLCVPLCVWGKMQALDMAASYLFSAGLGNLAMFFNAYDCVPADLFSKSYYNSGGSRGSVNWLTILITFGIMGIGVGLTVGLPGLKSQIILSALGLLGIGFHKPVFKFMENRFLKNRYKYMEKYLSK